MNIRNYLSGRDQHVGTARTTKKDSCKKCEHKVKHKKSCLHEPTYLKEQIKTKPNRTLPKLEQVDWPTMLKRKDNMAEMFDDGYDAGYADCLAECQKRGNLYSPKIFITNPNNERSVTNDRQRIQPKN